MKRYYAFALAAFAFPAHGLEAQKVFEKVAPSMLTVRIFDKTGAVESMGSGMIWSREQAVTACHVVEDAHLIKVSKADGAIFDARLIRIDRENDVCILQISGLNGTPVQQRIAGQPRQGDAVYAVGNPLGLQLVVTSGRIVGVIPHAAGVKLLNNAPVSPGSSGGGLFDDEGKLIGITTAAFLIGQNINLAASAYTAQNAAKDGKPPASSKNPGPDPDWAAQADILHNKLEWKKLKAHALAWREAYPTAPQAAYELSTAEWGLGEHQAALDTISAAVKQNPTNALLRAALGDSLRMQKRYADAETELRKAIEIVPAFDHPWRILAQTYVDMGKLSEARQSIVEALKINPGQAVNWKVAGDIEQLANNPAGANRHFQVALRLQPANAQLTRLVTDGLNKADRSGEAAKLLSQSKDDPAANAFGWHEIGMTALRMKKYGDAEQALRKALELHPGLKESSIALAGTLAETARLSEAEKLLTELLSKHPQEAEIFIMLGKVYWHQNRKEEAIKRYEQAVALESKRYDAWRDLANLYSDVARWRDSINAFERAKDSGTMTAGEWIRLGDGYMRANRGDDAQIAFKRAAELDPNGVHTLIGLALYHGRSGRIQEALEYAEKATVLDPSSANAWSSKGYALLKLNRLPESITALQTAVRLDPDSVNSLINLGEAHLRHKQLGASIQALTKAIKLGGPRPSSDARMYLAQAYAASGQTKLAREELDSLTADVPQYAAAWYTAAALGLATGDQAYTDTAYAKLKTLNPQLAQRFKQASEKSEQKKVKLSD